VDDKDGTVNDKVEELDNKDEEEDEEYHFVDGKVPCPLKCGKKSPSIFLAKVHFRRRHQGKAVFCITKI